MIESTVDSALVNSVGSVSTSSAWPVIDTFGELDATEWIHTNGAGAYAMSTVPMMHTRRYHGILVAPLEPPLKRFVSISHAELTLQANGSTVSIVNASVSQLGANAGVSPVATVRYGSNSSLDLSNRRRRVHSADLLGTGPQYRYHDLYVARKRARHIDAQTPVATARNSRLDARTWRDGPASRAAPARSRDSAGF